jgi:hypothetical protein
MWLLLIFSILLLECNSVPTCGVTKEFEEKAHIHLLENSARGRNLALSRGSTLSPIRIHFHYSLDFSMTSSQRDELRNFLIPVVGEYLQKVLRVYPLLNSLLIDSRITECSGFTIPIVHTTVGVPNTDLIVYLTAYNTNEDTVAWAAACIIEAEPSNNVVAGRININMYHFNSSMNIGDKITVLIHELTHLLGFSNYLFQYFHKPNGDLYTTDESIGVITQRGKPVTIAKFPTVVSKARAAFGCSTLQGLELEDQGGSGTAGSHWEKMLMYGDFMQGDTGADDWVFSDITFALLEDSGWYSIDYSQTDSITWGKNAGCSFFTNKCVSNGVPSSSQFCANGDRGCTRSRLSKGLCNLVKYTRSLTTQFQYFSDSTYGGSYSLMDFCPIIVGYNNGDCRDIGSSSTWIDPIRGEQTCLDCKCFNSNLLDNRYTSTAGTIQGCYKVRCDRNTSRFFITVGSAEKECPENSSITFTGYNGEITCVRYDEVCSNLTCPNFCLKRGQCVDGICVCDIGYVGDYCQNRCDISCKNCSGNQIDQCTQCRSGEVLSSGRCNCPPGTSRNATTGACQSNCNALCKTCNSTCTECIANAQLISGSNTHCECRPGFNLVDGDCIAICQELCASCDPNNGLSCLRCKSNSTLSGFTCVCNPGFILSETTCIPCNSSCFTCSSNPSACTSCKPNANLSPSGTCTCNSGYLLDYTSGNCIPTCQGLCETCSSNNASSCLKCKSNAILADSTCTCRTGFEYDIARDICIASCNNLCSNCYPSSGCAKCTDNSSILDSISNPSQCMCNSGFIELGNECVAKCNNTCTTCLKNSWNICTECKENANLVDGVCRCSVGYIVNLNRGECEINSEAEVLEISEKNPDSYIGEDSIDCEENLAPVITIIVTIGVYLIASLGFYFLNSRNSTKVTSQENKEDYRSVYQSQDANHATKSNLEKGICSKRSDAVGLDIEVDSNVDKISQPDQRDVNRVEDLRTAEISKTPVLSESFFKLYKEKHILYRIVRSDDKSERRYLLFTILYTLVLQYTLIGAFYVAFEEGKDESEFYTGVEVIEKYTVKDLGYVILALAVSLPASCLMQFKMKYLRAYILGLVIFAGSIGGSIYILIEYCNRDWGMWAMGCVLSAALQFVLGQNLTALIAAVVVKIRQN